MIILSILIYVGHQTMIEVVDSKLPSILSDFCRAWTSTSQSKSLSKVLKKFTHSVLTLYRPLGHLPKTLIGFSKGVVVLNQLLLDWHQLQKMDTMHEDLLEFYKSIHTWIWLDGGHNGGQDTWMTSEGPLSTFVNHSEWKIQINVTPRQVKDPMRPWIGKEEKKFRSVLKRLLEDRNESSRLTRTLFFAEEEPSILNHFRVIDTLSKTDLLGLGKVETGD